LRPKLKLRKTRTVHVAIATIMLAVPASAFALTTGAVSDSQAGPTAAINAQVSPRHTHANRTVSVTGSASASDAGHWAILQASAAKNARWHYLASGRIDSTGRFALSARLRQSSFVRVVDAAVPSSTGAVSPGWSSGPAGTSASAPVPVSVAAQFKLAPRSLNVLGGSGVTVRGKLLPAHRGRSVHLQGRFGRHWRTLARGRTGRRGGFAVHYYPAGALQRRLRVAFAGDQGNARTAAGAGRLTVYGQSVASWYNDAGNTACGFHATYGVANRTLPCGTKVRFRYGGRSVTATVDDRGPFVGGRSWDLNQNTAAALGFGGVGTVWVTQ
jgi:rare lipoprotein A